MQIAFRTDASVQIGSGHVMRCLTLARSLRQHGATVSFISREHPGHLCDYVQEQGFRVYRLPAATKASHAINKGSYEHWLGEAWETDARQTAELLHQIDHGIDLLIIDHYAIDIRWEQKLRGIVKKMMVIDDLANRTHDCEFLLDQNLYADMNRRYEGLVPEACLQLLGPRYALLREEFRSVKAKVEARNAPIQRILVFFGGSDPTHETEKALKALKLLNRTDLTIDVVVGRSNSDKEKIEAICSSMPNVHFYIQIDYMAELMTKADLSLGAGGSTTWERCFLGLPALIITTADNQVEVTEAVAKAGAVDYLGHYPEVEPELLKEKLEWMLLHPERLLSMSRKGLELMGHDAAGGADYIVGHLLPKGTL